MQVKVDEDLPRAVAQLLTSEGYEARTVVEQQLAGSTDAALWPVVQSERRFFVTADKGFADVRKFAPGTHCGLLLLRPDADGIPPVLNLMAAVLRETRLDALAGAVAVATPRGLRVRHPTK